jgi:micrococcal nuclease
VEEPVIWTVPGTVQRVIDGDTVVCRLDLGWHVTKMEEPVRVAGINSPELWQPGGQEAKAYAEELLPVGTQVTIISQRLLGSLDKYGRTLAAIDLPDGRNFGQEMVAAGHAVPYST